MAIEVYRNLIYTPRPLGQWQPEDELSPKAVLPEGATDLTDARKRFKDTLVPVWLSNEAGVLSRYILLLIETKHYQNFDRKRFVAALPIMFAQDGDSVIWYAYHKQEEMRSARECEVNKALIIKRGHAPALLAYADIITAQGKEAPPGKQRLARQ